MKNWRRQYHLRILNYLFTGLIWKIREKIGLIAGGGGNSHAMLSLEESVSHIECIWGWYLKYGEIDQFHGECVEIGPGDNAGIAMLMRHSGARSVKLLDRFRSPRNAKQQARIYQTLAQRYGLSYLKKGTDWQEGNISGIEWEIGVSAENFFSESVQIQKKYGAIVSCAAMEHLYDPLGCLENMILCLDPGGTMVHCIDFRDHGMFTPRYHPLRHLDVPGPIYRLMTRSTGDQNRVLLHEYRRLLEKMADIIDFQFKIYVWMLAGEPPLESFLLIGDIHSEMWQKPLSLVSKARRQFSDEFERVDDKDLAVAGICLVVKRSGRS